MIPIAQFFSRLPMARLLFIFGCLCVVTAWLMPLAAGSKVLDERLPAEGGLLGPMVIEDSNTIVRFEVNQSVPLNHWSTVSIALLDQDKQYLTGFGDDLWYEEGVDSEGYYWRESDTSYVGHLTVPKPGEYYLDVTAENDFETNIRGGSGVSVDVRAGGFSQVPHLAAGMLALFIALVLALINMRKRLAEGPENEKQGCDA